jgi:hypothetical protein
MRRVAPENPDGAHVRHSSFAPPGLEALQLRRTGVTETVLARKARTA